MERHPGPAGARGPVAAAFSAVNPVAWRTRMRAVGPGVVSAAADTDPTTVATLIVVGSTTGYALAWLTVLLLPMLAVVQTLATRVGVLSGRDLQRAVVDGYGRRWAGLLLTSVVAVNVVTVAADLEPGRRRWPF